MPVEVEMDVFSGRPNPKWSLDPGEETEFFERMSSLPAGATDSFGDQPPLGYRGLSIRVKTANADHAVRIGRGLVRVGNELKTDPSFELEKWLLETARTVDGQLIDSIKRGLSADSEDG